ncbi:unnamed protein product, partial [Durusdinium trenchii]
MGWSQGKGKQASWQAWNVWPPAKKKEKKEGKGKPSESKGPELPAYEALGSTMLTSSGSASGKGVDQLKQEVLDFLHSKDITPEGQLKELLQLGPLDDLKSEQRTLNTKKKLLAKLDKLKNKVREKKASWEVFLQKVKEHHQQQEAAYKSDLKTLEGAIAETQDELNKIAAKEQEGMDTSSGVEKLGEAELRRQLADSQEAFRNVLTGGRGIRFLIGGKANEEQNARECPTQDRERGDSVENPLKGAKSQKGRFQLAGAHGMTPFEQQEEGVYKLRMSKSPFDIQIFSLTALS